jgi:hypothetical protein
LFQYEDIEEFGDDCISFDNCTMLKDLWPFSVGDKVGHIVLNLAGNLLQFEDEDCEPLYTFKIMFK